jgi:hypothetical protein
MGFLHQAFSAASFISGGVKSLYMIYHVVIYFIARPYALAIVEFHQPRRHNRNYTGIYPTAIIAMVCLREASHTDAELGEYGLDHAL